MSNLVYWAFIPTILGIHSHKGNYRAGISRVRVLAAAGGARDAVGVLAETLDPQMPAQVEVPPACGLRGDHLGDIVVVGFG